MPKIILNGTTYAAGLDQKTFDKIGTDTLDTDAQDLSGAVNELNTSLTSIQAQIAPTNDIKYIRGHAQLSSSTSTLDLIQQAIAQMVTDNKHVIFDILIISGARFHFHGMLYPTKNYGTGILTRIDNDVFYFWRRSNNSDILRTVTTTS